MLQHATSRFTCCELLSSFNVFYFFHAFMFYVGLLIVRLCFMNDIVLFIDWLYCIDLFSCIGASVFNKLTYLLTMCLITMAANISVWCCTVAMWGERCWIHTHPFNCPFPGLPRWAGTRKVKPIWNLPKQETVASAGPYASLHLTPDRQPRQHPTTQFFTGRMSFLPPNQQRQNTEGFKALNTAWYCPQTCDKL